MPVRFTITIDTGNAAFEDDPRGEGDAVAYQIASWISEKIAFGQPRPTMHHAIRDTNGNLVGHLMVEGLAEEDGPEEDDGEVVWMKIVPNVRTGGREGNA